MQQKALGRRLNGTGAEAAASESSLEGTAWLLIDCVQADQDLPGVVKAWPPPAGHQILNPCSGVTSAKSDAGSDTYYSFLLTEDKNNQATVTFHTIKPVLVPFLTPTIKLLLRSYW